MISFDDIIANAKEIIVTEVYPKKITLPDWLDNLLFNDLEAEYYPAYSNMTNIHDDRDATLRYLGTYFPRSYAEAYSIFTDYFEKYFSEWQNREEISIFDFGCGTGGEIIGLLTALNEKVRNLKKVRIVALDGNQNALRYYEKVLSEFQKRTDLLLENISVPVFIEDFYDLNILDTVLKKDFDIILSFKAICEFVTEQQFEQKNPYEHIVNFMLPKLKSDGIILIEDITTKNCVSDEWLPLMMDRGLNKTTCRVIERNEGYNQMYIITHSHKSNDKSKVAWRVIKR